MRLIHAHFRVKGRLRLRTVTVPSVRYISCIFRVNSNRSAQYPLSLSTGHGNIFTSARSHTRLHTQSCGCAAGAQSTATLSNTNHEHRHQIHHRHLWVQHPLHRPIYTVWCGARSRAVQRPCSSLHPPLFARDSAARVTIVRNQMEREGEGNDHPQIVQALSCNECDRQAAVNPASSQ